MFFFNYCLRQQSLPAIFEKKRLSLSLLCLPQWSLKVENGYLGWYRRHGVKLFSTFLRRFWQKASWVSKRIPKASLKCITKKQKMSVFQSVWFFIPRLKFMKYRNILRKAFLTDDMPIKLIYRICLTDIYSQ